MAEQYQFKTEFEPILFNGQTAQIRKADGQLGIRIEAVGALPSYKFDLGSLSTSTIGQEISALEMGSGMMAQYRMVVRGQFELEFSHPDTTVQQWRGKSQRYRLRPISSDGDMNYFDKLAFAQSEFFVYEDETPRFDFYPLGSGQNIQGYLEFHGFRYKFSKLQPGEKGILPLWVNSWPSGG